MCPPEREEAVTSALARIHIPHDSSLAHTSKRPERLCQHLVIHLGTEVPDEDMEMVLRVLSVLVALVRPIDPYIRIENLAPIERGKSLVRRAHVGIFDKTVIESAVLEVAVLDDLGLHDGTSDGKDLCEHVVGDPG